MTPRLLRNSLAKTVGVGLCFLMIGCGGSDEPAPEATGNDSPGTAAGTEAADAGSKEDAKLKEIDKPKEAAGQRSPVEAPDPLAGVDLSGYDTKLDMVTYSWDPQAGDKSVSAEDGGPGFTGEGWETNLTFPALGSKDAIKGGSIRLTIPNWPATLRLQGKDYNTSFNYRAVALCQETLLTRHPVTEQFIPILATHWKISEAKDKYTFRINPEARWSDGREVVAQDVVATFNLMMDDRLLMPSNRVVYGKFAPPVALSKYIVEVAVKEESWRNFIYFSGMQLFPAHEISIPGDEYLKEYQNRYTAVTGAYTLSEADVDLNRSLTLRRRDDWWGKDNPAFQGLNNFDSYFFKVVGDESLALEMAKKGDLDYYVVPKAAWWVEELTPKKVEAIKRGHIQKRKFFTDAPVGTSGLAFNMTRAPLDDVRIRKALALTYDRFTFIKKIFHNEYLPLDSYWQYGNYRNPANKMVPHDLFAAVKLLREAGWNEKDSDGIRIKDGKRLSLTLSYRSKLSEPYLTPYQEACKKAGVEINLRLLDGAAAWKNLLQREFDISAMAWGGLSIPNPETSWKGELASQVDNNNITAFASDEIDELLVAYDREYDPDKRSEIIRQMDAIIHSQHPYALGWYGPAQRVMYQNKFGMPKFGASRTADTSDLMFTWWVDPEKEKQLKAAQRDPSIVLPTLPEKDYFWKAYAKANAK